MNQNSQFIFCVEQVAKVFFGNFSDAKCVDGILTVTCATREAVKFESELLERFNGQVGIILSRVGDKSSFEFV